MWSRGVRRVYPGVCTGVKCSIPYYVGSSRSPIEVWHASIRQQAQSQVKPSSRHERERAQGTIYGVSVMWARSQALSPIGLPVPCVTFASS